FMKVSLDLFVNACACFLFSTESRCVGRACSPPMGNLASGRTLFTLTSCCTNSSSCLPTQPRCLAELHPPALMADDPFIHPDTWWGSAAATGEQEEIRLDLETRFCMSHVVMLFRSPRPAAMRLERSQDFGQTWETLTLFARNCTEMFGLPDDISQPGSLCTSRYSNVVPMLTAPTPSSDPLDSTPFAVYSLLAKGTCLCHGHAEHCLPENEGQDSLQPSLNGQQLKCECHGHAESCHFSQRVWLSTGGSSGGICDNCQHNTVGRRCQRCCPGYHRHPARPLNSPHACTLNFGSGTPWCHPRSGQCHCKPGVGGTTCSHCLPGYWSFGEEGCKSCVCPLTCDPVTGHWKCSCKEKKLKSVSDLCKMKHTYVIKASVLSAHDKGTHAVVLVKVRKVFRSGKLPLSQGTHSLYPLSWTSRGCTCPILNPGGNYLLAGPEDVDSGWLLVTMQSLVVPWTPILGFQVTEALHQGCL
uniref:Netrin-4-like n=1 Tax=Sinocyclocheilus anshuiensis TaxID=1608454 RepID=A0A671RFF7_9TELE